MSNPKSQPLEANNLVITNKRYVELIRKEAQLDFVKKWLQSNARYYNYADVSDLLLLLDIGKEQEKTTNEK